MCSTCGCGKKADTFEAPKRQRIGNRYISRRKDGTFSKNVDVGRSLSADRRKKAKTTASAGQGDKGDLKRAESKFDKLSNEIAKDYEKKGKSKDEAEEIGKATAYKIGVAKYGKRGMERKARAGRAKNAESFGADDDDGFMCVICGEHFFGDECPYMGEHTQKEIDYALNNIGSLYYAEGFDADEKKRSGMNIAPKIQMVNYQDVMTEKMKNQNMKDAEEFDAQYVIVHGEDGRRKAHKTGLEERDGFTPQFINEVNTEQLGDYVPSDSAIGNVAFENHAESFGADGYFPDDSYYGIDEMTYVKRPHHVAYIRKAHAERPMDKGFEYPNMHTDQNKQGKIWDDRSGFRKMDSKERGLFEEIGGKISDFDVVGTTQDVVGKTGFNIPTGVASIAVVFLAYMTGKKYGN